MTQSNINKPEVFTAIFEDKLDYEEKFSHYSFELKQPHQIDFRAGQYLSLKVNEEGLRRPYSIISDPDVKHGVELLLDNTPQGPGTKYLQSLQFGDEIEFLAPLGEFTVKQNQLEQALTFVATGSGIAPIRAMIHDQLKNKEDERPIILYWGLRYIDDLIWEDEFGNLTEYFPNFKFHPILSKPVKDWPLCRGRVTDCLQMHDLLENSGYYLCGNQEAIKDVKQILQTRGVKPELINHEKFY